MTSYLSLKQARWMLLKHSGALSSSSVTALPSFPAHVNRLGWINEMQEMGKCSLNPDLFFLVLEEKKGKERGTQGKCTWGESWASQGRDSLLKGRRTIRDQLEQQGEPKQGRKEGGVYL